MTMHEEFEEWVTNGGNYTHRKHKTANGNYLNEYARISWEAWQAAWQAARQPEQPAAPINQAYEG